MAVRFFFNCKSTPAFNVIETVFGSLKFSLRAKNCKELEALLTESRFFLDHQVSEDLISSKLRLACKFFMKAAQEEEF